MHGVSCMFWVGHDFGKDQNNQAFEFLPQVVDLVRSGTPSPIAYNSIDTQIL